MFHFVYLVLTGMTDGIVSDLMGGHLGPVPMDIALEAAELAAGGTSPDHIADILGDKLQARWGWYYSNKCFILVLVMVFVIV